MENSPILKITDSYYTDFSGIKRLFDFFHNASQYYNTTIYLDFYHLDWFDANLSAIFGSMLMKLSKENNLKFSADIVFLQEKFSVLFRNGFFIAEQPLIDEQKSTVVFQNISPNDKAFFVQYIESNLMNHRGMPQLTSTQKDKIFDSLIEVFTNIQIHSKAQDDFFVCGQYYPSQSKLIFTMVDLGVGFLPAINTKTNNEITDSYKAILWALEYRNSTKIDCPGGLGLSDLYKYFKSSNGDLQIITGDTYWALQMENTLLKKFNFPQSYVGSIINLVFNCK